MARIVISGDALTVELTAWEKTKAVHGDITVPLASVRHAAIIEEPLQRPHGIRSPGTSVPGVTKAGTWRSSTAGRQFVLVNRGEKALHLTLVPKDSDFDSLLVAVEDPEQTLAELRAAASL